MNKQLEAAKAKQQQVELENAERSDILAAENLGAETMPEHSEPSNLPPAEDGGEKRESEVKEIVDPRTAHMNELIEKQRQERDEKLALDKENNFQKPIEDEFHNVGGEGEFDNTGQHDVNFDKPGIYGDKIIAKVDGQLVEIPADKALSILQKNESADKRLEQSALREQSLAAREQNLLNQERQFQLRTQQQPPSQGVVNANSAEVQEEVKQFASLLEEGETDEAVKHLAKVLTPRQPAVTPQQVAEQVKRKMIAEQATSLESQLKNSGKYDDIFGNAQAYKLAIENVQQLQAQGHTGSMQDIMVESMELVRDFRSGVNREERLAAQGQDDKTNSRQQRKASAPRTVNSGGQAPRRAVQAKQNEPTPEQKRASLFEQQKALRNQ